MSCRIGQQPMQHGAERRDAGTGCDKDGIAQRRPQNEVAERPLAADFITLSHVAEKIRHEAVLHAVEAESEAIVVSRWGSDGVGARDLLAVGLVGFKREPLPGDETEAGGALYLELKMLGE